MYDGTVELFSYALEEGMGVGKASGPCELPKTSAFTSSLFRRKGRSESSESCGSYTYLELR